MLTAEASVGAPAAWSRTRFCSGGTVAKPRAPMSTMVTAAAILSWAVTVNRARTTASVPSDTYSMGIRCRSANLPPMRLPPTMPRPKRTSSQVTDAADQPAAPVIIGVM